MDRYSYYSEEQAIIIELKTLLDGKGNDLLEYYLKNGFEALAEQLKLQNDLQKQLLFDYLMLERKAILECIRRNKAFFLQMIIDGRGQLIRPILGVKEKKYDVLWREALDLLCLYFAEKKVIDRMTNGELEKFLEQSVKGAEEKEQTEQSS